MDNRPIATRAAAMAVVRPCSGHSEAVQPLRPSAGPEPSPMTQPSPWGRCLPQRPQAPRTWTGGSDPQLPRQGGSASHSAPQPFSLWGVFQIGAHFLPGAGLQPPSSYLASWASGITDTTMHGCLLRWGLTNCLSRLVLNHRPPELCLQSSLGYRFEAPAPGFHFVFETGSCCFFIPSILPTCAC
jgi:hypothetical protein